MEDKNGEKMTDSKWWICTEQDKRISGPYTTRADALIARTWVERVKHPETFWVKLFDMVEDLEAS